MANILITGASNGIGYETALALAADGHRVMALARSAERLHQLQDAAFNRSASPSIHILPFDIVNGDYQHVLLPAIREKLEQIDALINNAGSLINKPFETTTIADFNEMFQSNVIGHVRIIQNVLSCLPAGSHIVNIGSMGGFQGSVKFPGLSAYSATKAALHALTECMAMELADRDIKINCLALGSAQTEMLAKAFPTYQSPVSASTMGAYIADFALTGHRLFNGKILPVAVTTP